VDVIKAFYCDWPRFEDEDFIMTAGSFRPLEDAFRIAHTQLVYWLAADVGLSVLDAYQLVSQVARSPIANVVDTNYTVLAKFPKRYLPSDLVVMGGAHARLRKLGAAHLAN
jgi:acetamidase/formamidase